MKDKATEIKVLQCKTSEDIDNFIKLPKEIYKNEYCPQDISIEKALLTGKHTLSNTFEVIPLLAYIGDKPAARCIVTNYKDDSKAYIGLFESIENQDVYIKLLSKAENISKELGKTKMIGPVDASFWIKYRFKYSSDIEFKNTYSGEPYNKETYTPMWENYGFNICDVYISNVYRKVVENDKSAKCELRTRQMEAKNYTIRHCSFITFNKDIKKIYNLMIKLYSKFPTFKHIEFKEFKEMFKGLKFLLNYSMTWIIEKENEEIAFFICIPNYHKLNLKRGLLNKIYMFMKLRNKPDEYIMLYMGVKEGHLGLGSVLAELAKRELYINQCTSVGALIHGSKPTGGYYKNLITASTKYVLLEKKID